jgi:hypothetical protein
MEAAAPTLEQSLAFPDGIARDGDGNEGDIPYGIDDIDDYEGLVEPRPGEAYTQEDVNVMDRPEFDRRYAQHAWYRRLGAVGMGEDNFPGTTDARRRGRQVSFLLGAPTVWERNIDARRRHIQTNAAIPDPRMGDTRTRVREAENPGLAWQTPDAVARDIDQEFQDFHNEQMGALRTYGTERHRQAVERQRCRHAEEHRDAEELRRIERMANDPADAFDAAQDMRQYIDDRRERARVAEQAGDGKNEHDGDEQYYDAAEYRKFHGPWDPPDDTHRYTDDDIDSMTRAQFDDRRRLHNFYMHLDLGDYQSGLDHRREQLVRRGGPWYELGREFEPVAVGTIPSDPPGLTQPAQWGHMGEDGVRLDPQLGDRIFPVVDDEMPQGIGPAGDLGRLHAFDRPPLAEAYRNFHEDQVNDLTDRMRQRLTRARGLAVARAAVQPRFHGPVHDAQRRRCEEQEAAEQAGDGKRKHDGVRKNKDEPTPKRVVTDEDNPTVMQNPAAQLGPTWTGATPPLTRALPMTREQVQARTAGDRFDACVTGAVRALDDAQQGSGLYHHIGASAEQQIIAGTGLIPAPPGSHMMSTGVIMPDFQAGAGLSALLKNDPDRPGLNPRPYNYLGPGNPLDGKLPYNKVDAIAMEHDRAYGAATSYKDIDNADRAFVRQMQTQPGLVAPLASLTIGAKNRLERAVGPIYPSTSALNRARECQQNAPTAGFPI